VTLAPIQVTPGTNSIDYKESSMLPTQKNDQRNESFQAAKPPVKPSKPAGSHPLQLPKPPTKPGKPIEPLKISFDDLPTIKYPQ
jgi:hypothetical protein